ncbi:MAG: OB-fold nucleic acid binding domain-containing protein, partial [Candidatus Paceibacterota bacterium]
EFMAALITSEKNDVERVGYLIGECKNMGIEVLSPDINESFYGFTVIPGANKIRFGLSAIKNVGENTVSEVVANRKANGQFADIFDFMKRINPKVINRKSLEALIKAGAFDAMAERNTLLANIEKLLEIGRENEKNKSNGQRDLFGGSAAKNTPSYSLSPAREATKPEKLMWEKELLGLFITSHPLEEYKDTMEKKCLKITRVKENPAARLVKIGGMISMMKKIITKTGKPMLFMNLEDLTDKIEVVVFASAMEKNPAVFSESKIVYVYGRVDNRDGETKIVADTVEEVLLI